MLILQNKLCLTVVSKLMPQDVNIRVTNDVLLIIATCFIYK